MCLLQLFKLLPEWILVDLADFMLFGLLSANCCFTSYTVAVTAVQAAAFVNSGRVGGFPVVYTAMPALPAAISAVILCLLELFKLLPEWILDDLADFLLFGLQ